MARGGTKRSFTEEELAQAAVVQASLLADRYFADVEKAIRGAVLPVAQQISRPYARAFAAAFCDAIAEKVADAREGLVADLTDPPPAARDAVVAACDALADELTGRARENGSLP